MATRRISWIDQRINDGVAPFLFLLLPWSGVPFFWRRRIGAMADHRHHGEGEHHQRNVAMPPMPGSALVASAAPTDGGILSWVSCKACGFYTLRPLAAWRGANS